MDHANSTENRNPQPPCPLLSNAAFLSTLKLWKLEFAAGGGTVFLAFKNCYC